MSTWFECTAKYIRMDETGHEKKVSETYLLDAISFTEAESRIYTELQALVSGEFTVSKIAKTRISEIIPSDLGDRWFKSKVTFITIDEESGKEKRTSQMVLVFSSNVKEAYDQIITAMQGMMADFEISAISESTILDVFPYLSDNSMSISTKGETTNSFGAGVLEEEEYPEEEIVEDYNHEDLDPIEE